MTIQQTAVPTLSIVRVEQHLVYTFAANQPDAPLPVVAVQPDGVTLQNQWLERLTKEIQALYHFYRQNVAPPNFSDPLLPLGNLLFRELFPAAIRLALTACSALDGATLLLLTTEDEVSWELAHDGQQYLGMRWAVTRSIFSAGEQPPQPPPEAGWQILLIGNPTDDLPHTEQEIEEIDRQLARYVPQAEIWSFPLASKTKMREALTARHYRLIHYSGHARFKPGDPNNSGLLLAGHEVLTAPEIQTLLGGRPWVFLNACNSAQSEPAHEASVQLSGAGLAKAFMLGGAQLVLGTLWPVPDQGAATFAAAVYAELLKGAPVAQALRNAKIVTWQERPYDPVWAAYTLYGPAEQTLIAGNPHRLYPVVTVLRAQFRGVDEYLARSQPDELDRLATQTDQAIAVLQQQIERYGGLCVRTDTHGLTAIFGLPPGEMQHSPLQTDDQAERALGVATASHAALRHAFATTPATRTAQIQVAIGIAMGAVLFNPNNGHLFGRAAEVAAWLAQQAQPGQSLAEEPVVQSTRQRFQTLAWSAPASAGLSADWRFVAAEVVLAPRNQIFERELSPLIGRKQPLQRLLQAWQETRVGQGQLVEVVGAAGIGKSHLVHEFGNLLLGQNARCLFIRCSVEEQRLDYALLAALVRRSVNLANDAPPEVVLEIVRNQVAQARLADRADIAGMTNVLCQLIGMKIEGAAPLFKNQEKLHRELVRALLRLLASLLTVHGRVALIVEDLHYVDEASLDIFRQLLAGLHRQPLFCLVTYRTQWQPQWSTQLHAQRVWLETLSLEESIALINQPLQQPLPLSIAKEIAIRANYNPLFIVELGRMLRQHGFLRYHNEQWSLSGPLTEAGTSLTMQSTMQSRVNALPATLRQILEEIAVLGSAFTWDLTIDMLTQTHDRSEVEDSLQTLHDLEFIDGYLIGNELRFVHDLVQQEILHHIEPSKRRAYHLRAARAWQEAGTGIEQVNRMADHLYQGVCETIAGQVRVITPQEIGQAHLTQAANTLIQAGEQAQSMYIHQNALDHYQRAVAVTTVLGEQWRAAEVARRIGRIYMFLAKWERALEWMSRGLHFLAIQATEPTHSAAAEAQATAALIHIHRGSIYYYQGQYALAVGECRQGLALAESQQAERAIAEGCKVLGAVLDAQGQGQEALEIYQRGLRIAEALHDRYLQAQLQDNIGTALFPQGRWDEAFEMDRRGLAFWEEVNDRGNMAIAALNAGMIYLHRGAWAEAQKLFQQAQEACNAVEDYRHLALAHTNLGLLCLAQGDIQQGEMQLQTSLKLLADHQIMDISVETLCGLSEAALLSGDSSRAIQLAQAALEGLPSDDEMPLEKSIALRNLGLGYALIGDMTNAEQCLGESLQVAEAFQIVFEGGRTRLALAQVCGQTSRTSEATLHLDRALEIFTALKATPLIEKVQQLRNSLRGNEV